MSSNTAYKLYKPWVVVQIETVLEWIFDCGLLLVEQELNPIASMPIVKRRLLMVFLIIILPCLWIGRLVGWLICFVSIIMFLPVEAFNVVYRAWHGKAEYDI